MSHITDGQLKVRNLDDLEVGGKACGLALVRGQTAFKWYGRFVGDSPGIVGRDPKTYGQCEHVLRRAGHQPGDYEIGIVRAIDGDGYDLHFDSWGPGRKLEQAAGPSLNKLRQEYALAVASRRAREKLAPKGFRLLGREALDGGRVRLRLRRG